MSYKKQIFLNIVIQLNPNFLINVDSSKAVFVYYIIIYIKIKYQYK